MTMKLKAVLSVDNKDMVSKTEQSKKSFKGLQAVVNGASKDIVGSVNQVNRSINKMGDQSMATRAEVRQSGEDIVKTLRRMAAGSLRTSREFKNSFDLMQAELRQLNVQMAATAARPSPLTPLMASIGPLVGAIGGLYAVFASVGAYVRWSDEFTSINNKMRLVTTTAEELDTKTRQLTAIANNNRVSVAETVDLYAKLARATKTLGVGQNDLLKITSAINQSFLISGASTQEAAGSTRQLAQALASGVLRGDEFNSVAEQAPRLMEALGEQTGKTIGELRKMAEQGELTADLVTKALIASAADIQKEFETMTPTISQSFTVLTNNVKGLIDTFNDLTGSNEGLSSSILSVADALGSVNSFFESGQSSTLISAYTKTFRDEFNSIMNALDETVSGIDVDLSAIGDLFDKAVDFYVDAWRYLPIYATAIVKEAIVRLTLYAKAGAIYGKLFAQNLIAEFDELVAKIAVLGQELADQINPFDGSTFDMSAQLKKVTDFYSEQKLLRTTAANDELKSNDKALAKAIASIDAERAKRKQAFDEEVSYAEFLRKLNDGQNGFSSPADLESDSNVNAIASTASSPTQSQLEKLRQELMTEEELRRDHLQRRIDMINSAGLEEMAAAELIQKSVRKFNEETAQATLQRNNMMLTSAQQMFGGIAGIVKSFSGEQSKAYRVMFAIQKGFAVAQGIMNLTTAISQASVLPFPANIPAMATAAATGASLVATLQGAQYQGQAHDGLARVPAANEGTYMLRRDEMVLNPRQRDNFEEMRKAFNGSGNSASKVYNYTFSPVMNITSAEGGSSGNTRAQVEQALQEYDQMLQEDLASNGPRAQLLSGRAA